MDIKGFFVDWNGDTRRTEAPGDGFRCIVDPDLRRVDVLQSDGCYVHEGMFFTTLEDVKAAGVEVNLIESTLVSEREWPAIIADADGIIVENCVFVATPKSATVPDSGVTSSQ
ncbi:hypothetical protein V0M98_33905 (plasmid) [Pseudomonas silesiensis]|uniref:hypothetical protein n=1 Tax=Pseudomonas silesiensis TaxID=1853130 RepID=UPI0030CE8ADC